MRLDYLKVAILVINCCVYDISVAQNLRWEDAAREFIQQKRNAEGVNGIGAYDTRFELVDLDGDEFFEILEFSSYYQEHIGFLNEEIAPAFEWVNIYSIESTGYTLSNFEFPEYLRKRENFYSLWLKLLEAPQMFNEDSQALIFENKPEFVNVIRGYLKEIEGGSRKEGAK